MHRDRNSDSMSFCRDLLQRDPSQRCSASVALGHSYFEAVFNAKKAMVSTQDTLDPFDLDPLESDDDDDDDKSVKSYDSEIGELPGTLTSN